MSFQQGLSGLAASAKNLDTIGNNVANANTVGFILLIFLMIFITYRDIAKLF